MGSWKVGILARRAGLTVRTLHHWDRIGLLSPSGRTAAGHRLYTPDDVARLQQVVSLRSLGLPLDEIRALLARGAAPRDTLRLHADRLRARIRAEERLLERLDAVAAALDAAEHPSADDLLTLIGDITMFDKYYTPEQLDQLARRRDELGETRIGEVEAEWPRLMDEVRAEMEKGTDPSDPRVQALAARWTALVEEFTGGDPGIRESLGRVYQSESSVHGMDVAGMRPMMEYIGRARSAGG